MTRALIARLLFIVVAAGCTDRRTEPERDPPPPLDGVEFAGCREVYAGPVCALPGGAGPVALHLPRARQIAGVRVELDGHPVERGVGARFEVEIPPGARELVARDGPRRWSLTFADETPADDPAVTASAMARALLRDGHWRAADAAFARAAPLHVAAGRLSAAIADAQAGAYALMYRVSRFALARARLDIAAGHLAALPGYAEARAVDAYFRGLLAMRTGDLRTALRQLADARARYHRVGLERLAAGVDEMYAIALQTVGRDAEAEAVLQTAASVEASDCERARHLTNLGWARVLAAEAGTRAGDADSPLREALELYGKACPRPTQAANVRVNLALAALQARRPDDARRWLATSGPDDGDSPTSSTADNTADNAVGALTAWHLEIRGRAALAEGRAADALTQFDALAARAEAILDPAMRWRAATSRGRALEDLERSREALDAYAAAEALLDDAVLRVPLDAGRTRFAADRARSAQRRIGLLIRLGRTDEALCALRRARARPLVDRARADRVAALDPDARARWESAIGEYRRRRDALDADAAEDWKRPAGALDAARAERRRQHVRVRAPLDDAFAALGGKHGTPTPGCDTLRPPEPGELMLAYARGPDGWIGIAADANGAEARDLGPVEPAGPALLTRFDDRIAAAKRLTFFPTEALQRVDLHALPWRGAPLIAARDVAYGVDVSAPTTPRSGRRAVVIADPDRTLRHARAEARDVAGRLEATGWAVTELSGAAASGAAARAALADTTLLHYAGHAEADADDPWGAALRLAGGASLTVGDVLALPSAPRHAVLTGCRTGAVDARALAGTGIAHAFLLAGGEGVVAATRDVEDALAGQIGRALHAGDRDLVAALRRAVNEIRIAHPDADWAAFRVWIR